MRATTKTLIISKTIGGKTAAKLCTAKDLREGGKSMLRNLALVLVLCGGVLLAGCSTTETNSNQANSNAGTSRDGVVETNANIPANANRNNVPSNTAVVTNNNGNENTSGVKSTNDNANRRNRNRP
jgi:hypothetical protein